MSEPLCRVSFSDVYSRFSNNLFENGLKVHHLLLPEANFMHVSFIVHCGARQDSADKQGMAHFVEHLFSKSTSVDKDTLESFFRDNGGDFCFGKTFPEATTFGLSLPARQDILARGVSLFAKSILSLELSGHEQEKRIVSNEIDSNRGDRIFWEKRTCESEKVFYWHPFFSNPDLILGSKSTIKSLSPQEVQAFHDCYYIPANIEIVAVGGLQEQLFSLILAEAGFLATKNGQVVTPLEPVIPELPLEKVYLSPAIEENQDEVVDCCCIAALPSSSNSSGVTIFTRMLNEVLKKRLREDGLSLYHASSGWRNLGDFFKVWIDIDTVEKGHISKTIALIDDCLNEVALSQELFDNVKRWSLARYGVSDEKGEDIISSASKDLQIYRRIISLTESYDNLVAVKLSDVGIVANEVLSRLWKGFFRTS
jgi:predicted Zn-dependent peptidase